MFSKDRKIFWGCSVLFYGAILLWTALRVNQQPPVYLAEAKAIIFYPGPEPKPQLPGGLEVLPRRGQSNPAFLSFPIPDEFLKKTILRLTLIPEWRPQDQYQEVLSRLRAQTDSRHLPDGEIVRFRVLSTDPLEAERIANALATAFAEKIIVQRVLPATLLGKPKLRNLLVASLAGLLIAFPAAHLIQKSLSSLEPPDREKA